MEPPRILCPEVIGRDADLEVLAGRLNGAFAGFGRMVLIAGDAGVGKSAVLRLHAARARDAGARFLSGECVEVEARRPFGPFVQILRSIDREFSTGTLRRLIHDIAPELARLIPELGSTLAPAQDASERYRIHESLVSLFRALAQRSPLVVAIEDLHWADEATLELLPYLVRGLRGDGVLIIASYRPDDLGTAPAAEAALADLERGRMADHLELVGLSAADTARVIQAALRLEYPPTRELVDAIHERCEGNPFFTEEVLKALADRGDIVLADGRWHVERAVATGAIPASVRIAVERRTAFLSPTARRVLQLAAVIGRRFDFDLLREVADVPDRDLAAALREAIAAQLVVTDIPVEGDERYSFRHALTREVILGELLQPERRVLHSSVGHILEARASEDPSGYVEELAYHFDEAADATGACRFHAAAGRRAVNGFAFQRSLRHLERALALTPANDSSLAELQFDIADAAALCVELPRSSRAADEAARLFEEAGDPDRAGIALYRAAGAYWDSGDSVAAASCRERGLRLLEPRGDSAALALLYTQHAHVANLDGRHEDAVGYADRAVAMARKTSALHAEVVGLRWLGLALAQRGDREGVERLRQCLALAREHELVREVQIAYLFLIGATLAGGATWVEVRPLMDDRVRHAERYGFASDQLLSEQCGYAMSTGDWDAAEQYALRTRSATIWAAAAELSRAFMLTAREGPARGVPLSIAATARMIAAGDRQWVAMASASSCQLMLLAGDMRGVLDEAARLADLLAEDYFNPGVSAGAVCALTAARELGDSAALEQWIERASTHISHDAGLHQRSRRAAARAERLVLEGNVDGAISALTDNFTLQDPKGAQMAGAVAYWSLLPITLMRLRHVDLLLQRGSTSDRAAAESQLEYVVAFWRKAEAAYYLRTLSAWAGEHGIRFPAPEVDAPAVGIRTPTVSRLTAREREVAALVSQGLSNRDIAARLVISERTAEGHVEQVRNKLGFHSRSQIAAWVATNR